jgi:hypothetical protein
MTMHCKMALANYLKKSLLPAQIAISYVALPRTGSPNARFACYRFLGSIRAEESKVVGVLTGGHCLFGSDRKLINTIHNYKLKYPTMN